MERWNFGAIMFVWDTERLCANCDELIGIYDKGCRSEESCMCAAYWLVEHSVKPMPSSKKTHCKDICGRFKERESLDIDTTGMRLYTDTFRRR